MVRFLLDRIDYPSEQVGSGEALTVRAIPRGENRKVGGSIPSLPTIDTQVRLGFRA